ncbi:LysR family transcriptional regulator [Leclercia pneumoniae]|uniref:LysR family transcriptional regulator n=1 Tax=Leclercia pneumoniae TaxID=2815358 RepID=A0ABX8JU59_9ENTR|nr:LysR family transcriptional regulator [Leclercia pneumoniae]QSW35976.1 LysR family transcriptional regulator [Leclercia pneumoniae]QWW79104.1 LysR family transcriptional regulator [Leclercia pneumoniae]
MHRSGLTELEVVMAVVRRGSFRAAAQELGMSATAVSNAVAGLESRLQTRLFNRTTRSVALTDAGQRYVARIGPALQEIRQASEEIHSDTGEPAGTLRLNVPNNVGALFLDALLIDYMQRYPKMRVETVSEARMIDIVAEGYDAGIRLAESVPQDMIAIPLTADIRQVVTATPDYFARHGTPTVPDDLLRHQGIGMRMAHGGSYRWELARRGEQLALAVPARFATSDLFASIRAVKAGLGVGFLPELYIQQELNRGELITALNDWTQPFAGLRLYYPGHRHIPPGLRALVSMIREHGVTG